LSSSLLVILENQELLSPAVGQFRASQHAVLGEFNGDLLLLGTLRRWGRVYRCVWPEPLTSLTLLRGLHHEEPVEFGCVLARIGQSKREMPPKLAHTEWELKAPCDGILHYSDLQGKNYVGTDTVLRGGELLAQIESMKLFYELRNEHGLPCRLKRWKLPNHGAVQVGASLAVFENLEKL
jgi:hypothetical protein